MDTVSSVRLILVMGLTFCPLTASVVVPALCDASGHPCATSEGDIAVDGFSSVGKYQEIFDQSAFPGPIMIRSMWFRRDITGSSFDTTFDLEVLLVATPHDVLLSQYYVTNYGGFTPTVVFDDTVHLVSSSIGTPRPFDVGITFSTPFLYTPGTSEAPSNLLLEIRNATPHSIILDGVNDEFHGQRVQHLHGNSGDDWDPPYSSGMVIEFSGDAVPEPATALLLLGGLTALWMRRRLN